MSSRKSVVAINESKDSPKLKIGDIIQAGKSLKGLGRSRWTITHIHLDTGKYNAMTPSNSVGLDIDEIDRLLERNNTNVLSVVGFDNNAARNYGGETLEDQKKRKEEKYKTMSSMLGKRK
jgi:hypothetical protein